MVSNDRTDFASLTELRVEFRHMKEDLQSTREEVEELKRICSYYDKMALKWGGFMMGIMALGALLLAGADRLKDKLMSWIP